MPTPPDFPAGPEPTDAATTAEARAACIEAIERAPAEMRAAIDWLGEERLDTAYKNWTARQIAHHLAHSHVNAYTRFMLALTEDRPVIGPYAEAAWVARPECVSGPIETPLRLLGSLHAAWVGVMRAMSGEDWQRGYEHPEFAHAFLSLEQVVPGYAWHGRHHTGQIAWLAEPGG